MKLNPAFFTLFLAAPMLSQTSQQTAPPPAALPSAPSASKQSATPATTPAPSVSTIQARSNLVVVDVVVTDKNRNPVHDLKAADFRLTEAGTAQTIKAFEEHSTANLKPADPFPKLPPGVYTNFEATPDNGPLNVLLLDRLNTPLTSQSYVQNQLVSFVKTMKPGTRVAIFGLNTHLIYLQGFTSDPKLLLAALEGKKSLPGQSPLLGTPAPGADGSTSENLTHASEDAGLSSAFFSQMIANVQQFEAQSQSFQTQLRARYTLEAMNDLARYLSGLPGRKNLIWFSGSFPLSILPNADLQNPFAAVADMQDQFRDATDLLTRSHVAVYPVDARGIQSKPGMQAEDDDAARYTRSPAAIAKDSTDFSQTQADEHSTMLQMAHDTGGEAFINTNGLTEAVTKAISAGANYYTIAYTPTDPNYDGRYRKIQLSLERQGLQLSYRRGYYADLPGVKPQQQRKQLTSSPLAPPAPARSMLGAMLFGSPVPTQILIKTYVGPAGPPTDETVADDNRTPEGIKGPFRKYNVNYAAAPQDLSLKTMPDNKYQAVLEFVVFVYDNKGQAVNTIGQSIHANLTLEDVRNVFKGGMQFHQVISVPVDGEYFLRIAVRDLNGDRVGAVEVPIDAVKNLPVVEPPPPTRKAPTLSDLPK